MIITELLVLPDEETIKYLSMVMSGCPFDLDLQKMHVVLNHVEADAEPQMKAESENVYVAKAGTLDIWYDTGTQSASLILPLNSPAMMGRVREVRDRCGSAFYGEHFVPHMIMKEHMPALSRHYRRFIRSISTTLATSETPLVYEAELLRTTEYQAVPQADFYASYLANVWNA